MAPNFNIAILSMALFCAGANGQAPPEKRAELKIAKFHATSYRFEFIFSVKITGTARLVLRESGEEKGKLQ
jgi:hypothetical protein